MKVVEKTVSELHDGDVVLHPIYRRDGLLLTNRYKIVTSSVRNHILLHCDKRLPLLVLEDSKDLPEFLAKKGYQDSQFLQMLRKVVNDHTKIFPYNGLDYRNYLDDRVDINDHPVFAYVNSTTAKNANALSAKIIQIKSLYNYPLWMAMERSFDSPLMLDRLKKAKTAVIHALVNDEVLMELYQSLKNYHDVLWTRSINTMSVALLIGVTVELSEDELALLALSALMADVGFTKIPVEDFKNCLNYNLLSKEIKNHLTYSLELIKASETCRNLQIVHGILDHHELYNGNGYPLEKKGAEISLFGRIIAIAQDYDTLVGGYSQERSARVLEAHLQIWNEKGKKWDPDILRAFFYRRNYCKVGQSVQLIDGQKGTVVGFPDFTRDPIQPVIRLENGELFDTSQQPSGFDFHTIL